MNRTARTLTAILATLVACVAVTMVGTPAQAAGSGPDGCIAATKPDTLRFRYVILGGVERTQVRYRDVVCEPFFPESQWVIVSRSRWVTAAVR